MEGVNVDLMSVCPECGHDASGNYCANCGGRLTSVPPNLDAGASGATPTSITPAGRPTPRPQTELPTPAAPSRDWHGTPPRWRLGTIPGIITIVVLMTVLATVVAAQASRRTNAQTTAPPAPVVTIPTPTTSGLDTIRADVAQITSDLDLVTERIQGYNPEATMRACKRLLADVKTAQSADLSALSSSASYEKALDELQKGAENCSIGANEFVTLGRFTGGQYYLSEVIDELNGLNT
jgi:hypothetical protein